MASKWEGRRGRGGKDAASWCDDAASVRLRLSDAAANRQRNQYKNRLILKEQLQLFWKQSMSNFYSSQPKGGYEVAWYSIMPPSGRGGELTQPSFHLLAVHCTSSDLGPKFNFFFINIHNPVAHAPPVRTTEAVPTMIVVRWRRIVAVAGVVAVSQSMGSMGFLQCAHSAGAGRRPSSCLSSHYPTTNNQ